MKTITRSTVWAVVLFYMLIAFEFFYMATPFAAYFYGVYKPFLGMLDRFPSLSWITGFFLPHLAEDTKSPLIDSIKIAGGIIAAIGLITFLICAFQVYYAKLFKKGMVSRGVYKYIRHPQYTAFAVCSFGLLLLWPRYLILFMFITLLFVYYLLAKAEERECESKFGESYLRYKDRTYMFLPIKFNVRFLRFRTPLLIAGLYLLTVFAALQTSRILKRVSISSLYSNVEKNAVYLSIHEIPALKMSSMIEDLKTSQEIQRFLNNSHNENAKLINYILPLDMYISEIPMIKPDDENCHVRQSSSSVNYKIVYTAAGLPEDAELKSEKDILYHATRLKPLIEVWYDLKAGRILKITALPAAVLRYKNIPEPVF
jgi:protein-S-isoprenylcysteine O-methyltransferase Ste14